MKKGVSSSLYDPRRCETDIKKISDFQTNIIQKYKRIGFVHAIDLNLLAKSKTQYLHFFIVSALAHQLLPLESHITVIRNTEHAEQNSYSQHDSIQLSLSFLSDEIASTDWGFITYREVIFFNSIKVEENACFDIEQKTILQSNSSVWFNLRRNRIFSSNAQLLEKTFETLADEFLKPEMEKKLPKVVKDALKYGKLYESTARQNIRQYLNLC